MYKAIIVDDEKKICQLILELGDWKTYDMEVAAICTDGEEALAAIERIRPDLVLTDVRMPVYDGLELIRRTNEMGLKPAFIIISGYKYFEYAYSAFKYGVIDYLLKPIDRNQLNEVLEKTCSMLERQSAYRQAEDTIRKWNEQLEMTNRRKMFRTLYEDGENFPKTAEELEQAFSKRLFHPWQQMLFIRTNRSLDDPSSVMLTEKLRNCLKNSFADSGEPDCRICSEAVRGGIAVMLDMNEAGREQVKSRLISFLHDAREVAGLFGNTWVSIGVGEAAESLAELPASAHRAEEAEEARIVLGGNRVLDLSEHRFSRITTEQIAGGGFWRGLQNALETLSVEAYRRQLDEIRDRMEITPPVAPEVVRQIQESILQEFSRYVSGQPELTDWEDTEIRWRESLEGACGLTEFFRNLETGGCDAIREWKKQKMNREKLPIRLAKAWIAEHYGDAVTLEGVAERVGLSPTYFSTHFRQMEGRTFSDYLTSVRMDAARELLSTTSMTNYEIAARIGYADEKYFGKVFKKEVGIRPGEYRKLYLRR